jgi:ABC-type hemin transport system substrate-binding protein
MVTEEEETRESITETIAQLASNYKVAEAGQKVKLEKEAKEFIKSVAKGKDEVKEYTDMYNEMKS